MAALGNQLPAPKRKSALSIVLRSSRLPFLLLTPVCVFLGGATALAGGVAIDPWLAGLTLTGALLAHIGVNTLNEYQDFTSGLDLHTRRTRFSGGSGALPDQPAAAPLVLCIGIASLVGVVVIGGFIAQARGFGILPIGIVGMLLIVGYTGPINRHPLACLVAPGMGFGVLMVLGTGFTLTGEYLPLTGLAATIPFLLVNNLLLLNQYPDIEADAKAGRRHLPIVYGIRVANAVYALAAVTAGLIIVAGVSTRQFPLASLTALLPLALAAYALAGALKHGAMIGRFPGYLAANVAVSILVPLLLGISLASGV